ncbi:MAG: hypothetical protein LLG20_18245 [Acidobacteriales bacterium]|nr:hypothetical protein [Terriglobales bacterium]
MTTSPNPTPEPTELPALTVRQPWASLIIYGYGGVLKDIENRDWPLPRSMWGKRVAIHSSLKFYPEEWTAARALIRSMGLEPMEIIHAPYGCVLGSVVLDRDVTASDSPWFFGPHGFVLRDPVALPAPVPARGALGFWKWRMR